MSLEENPYPNDESARRKGKKGKKMKERK